MLGVPMGFFAIFSLSLRGLLIIVLRGSVRMPFARGTVSTRRLVPIC